MKAITTLEGDRIRFEFPGCAEALRELAKVDLRAEFPYDQLEDPWKQRRTREQYEAELLSFVDRLGERFDGARYTTTISFQRTLRIPDDGRDHWLPPGLGRFPVRHLDDFSSTVPDAWRRHGGVMMPLWQSEALWIDFAGTARCAVKVAAGKVCAVSGEEWSDGLRRRPQNYCALPAQPWLDGFAVEKGIIRQFVAAPLHHGLTVEEQVTADSVWGGLQLQVYPMKPQLYWERELRREVLDAWEARYKPRLFDGCMCEYAASASPRTEMGLGAGGRMKQEIYQDKAFPSDYLEFTRGNRCFVHLCNSQHWESITGSAPPGRPPSAEDYTRAGLPWFDYYDDTQIAIPGGGRLADIKSVDELEQPHPHVIQIKGPKSGK